MDICDKIESNEFTDYVCISLPGHGGDHDFVDAMGLGKVVDGKPVYREGFNYAR